MYALVEIIYNVLTKNMPISEEDRLKLLLNEQNKDALDKLATGNVPFKTKKQVLVQEGGQWMFYTRLIDPCYK